MLQAIRDRLVGWVAWGILILISVPFIFMGVTDFGSQVKETVIIEVNDETISLRNYRSRYQSHRQEMQKKHGSNYRADLFDEKIQQNVIDAMVDEKLLTMLAEENNLQVGDKELSVVIRRNPDFQKDGKFDSGLYESKLGESGLNPASYESYLRKQLKLTAAPRLIERSSFVTAQDAQHYHSLLNQQRNIDYAIIDHDHFPEVTVNDEQAKTYYDKATGEFIRPAQVKFEYVRLNANLLVDTIEATEENVRRYYDEHIDDYVVEGRRQARHILLSLEDGKSLEDSPEVARKLRDVQEKIESGESFQELAKSYSDDSGSAKEGGDLGQVRRGDMVPPFEEALFALAEPGQISEPVRSSFGVHLIQLVDITPRKVKSFDEVKDELREDFVNRRAVELYYDQAEKMAEISYENPGTLMPVAEELGLQVQLSDWVSADNDAPEVEGNRDVLRAAFDDQLKAGVTNSDLIEIGENDVVVIRVSDSRAELLVPFEDAAEQVRSAARKEAIEQTMIGYVDGLLARLQSGESLKDVEKEEKIAIQTVDGLQREGNDLPAELSRGIFAMSVPADNKPAMKSIILDDGRTALVILREVVMPDAEDSSTVVESLRSLYAARDYRMILAALKEKAKIAIHKDKL